jgi:hypothetical protein
MIDELGTLGSDAAVQAVAAVAGAASLGAFTVASVIGPPRPCWTRNRCISKQADASACLSCSVYLRASKPALALVRLPEIGEIKRLAALGSTSD